MGNAESTLAFKNQFNLLCTQSDIPSKDPMWQGLVNMCVDHHQVFGVLSTADLRRIRDTHPENLETLINVLVNHLSSIIKPSGIGSTLEEQVLCCLRALERVIPAVYEKRAYAESIERQLWGPGSGILRELCDSLLRLAQLPGFCIHLQGSSLWAGGIGAATASQHSKQNQYNKCELLRLLLVVIGEPLYCLKAHGLEYMTSKELNEVAFLFCSLLNTGIQPSSFLPLSNSKLNDLALITCLQLVIYHGSTNSFRKLLAKLYREDDIKLLEERLKGSLSLPSASLLWELLQANPKFIPVPAESIVEEILAKQYDRREDDFVKLLTFVLIHQSTDLNWCSENARDMERLFSPFNEATVHIPALLDLLYNTSPFLQLQNEEQVNQFSAFAHSIMISKNKEYKLSLASSLGNILKENKLLIFKLKDLKDTGDEWIDEYFRTVREGDPSMPQQVNIPPMQRTQDFKPIQFQWDSAKMRWYKSALWGYAIQCFETQQGLTPWTNTDIQLFKVETIKPRPTLRAPQGAVQALGDMLWGFVSRE